MISQNTQKIDTSIAQNTKPNYQFALIIMAILFFTFGFITCLNDILSPTLKKILNLNYTQTSYIPFAFFFAYFLISPPSIWVVKKIGFQKSTGIGILITALGCLLFLPASIYLSFEVFLVALFTLGSGMALLQTAANPYIAILGSPETSSSRLTIVQAFNSLGTTLAPAFGTYLILNNLGKNPSPEALKIPYTSIGIALFLLALVIFIINLPKVLPDQQDESMESNKVSVWQHNHLILGAIGIFMYVGAEVSIGVYLVNYIGLPEIINLEEKQAGFYLSFYWGGAMVGRFLGSWVMQKIAPNQVLFFNAVLATILLLLGIFLQGFVALMAILLIGLCNSIMFPTIFTLAIKKLGKFTEAGAGILCMAIVGGALVPVLHGKMADIFGLQISFLVPVICYIYIAFFGFKGYKVNQK
ncbi:MAG: sugar MFS transporter [Bacteroidetes bacterium]|nr:MAG: sugar MFS transporter [Bacteroidota bacterium]TAG90571.1 MAG: sugar MFS transporter [Bacteroidota bacterium]